MELDFQPGNWTGRDFIDYRAAVGEDLTESMAKIAASEGKNLPVDALFAVAWITARRNDPTLTYDEVLDTVKFGDLIASLPGEGDDAEADPTGAAEAAAE